MRTAVASAASVGLLSVGVFAALPAAAAPAPAPVAPAIGDAVYDHLEALQSIADANGGNRALGTPGYEASAAYIETTLRAAGYAPERQYFDVSEQDVTSTLTTTPVVSADDLGTAVAGSPDTPVAGLTGSLVQPVDAGRLGCDAAAYEGVDLTGSIALVSRGSCLFSVKVQTAAAAGAAGVVLYNNVPGALSPTVEGATGLVPTTALTQAQGTELGAALAEGPVSATLVVQTVTTTVETFNILAETSTGRDDNVVMLGAHLDSVPEGPGINDNGSGSAAVLETAVRLADDALNNQVRFAWWGAEEVGLVGSTHYVDDLVANDPTTLDEIATYLNFDMVGSPNYVISVYDADQSTFPAPVTVPEGSEATEDVFTDYFDGIGQAWVDTEFSGRSDYQAFIANGVPASGLFTGADDVKTEEEVALFGGTAGIIHDPNYHTPGDDLSNIDTKALDIMSQAILAATTSLAADTSAVNGVQPPRTGLVVENVRANTLCLLGKAVVVVGGRNGDDVVVDLTYGTPYGQRVDTTVQPGEQSVAFLSSKAKRVPAGTATVTATATVDGVPVSQTYEVAYPGKRC
ncbi:M20/M25/M40 family metallo-hydrolase [Modestobacter sp. Leaf380]|uniref:M20/M25/M40 family metallo-hydrolase n=1 Tax=Modestobacter sp. Leaf380 TaxID=1736356 RepID=UPI001F3D01FF|nr:M20/M25/M40 family metallo-hydrolase [Modestobacter sp. Leaf380]